MRGFCRTLVVFSLAGVVDCATLPRQADGKKVTPPKLIGGELPKYTQEAIDLRVEGKLIAECVITTQGNVVNCQVKKSLPPLDKHVLECLERLRYIPATLDGTPVEVRKTYQIVMMLPPPP